MIATDLAGAIAGYFDFILDFVVHPWDAMGKYKGKARVDEQLTLFALVGVGLAAVIGVLARALGVTADDSSSVLAVLRPLDEKSLPIAAILTIIGLAILVHVVARVYIRFESFGRLPSRQASSGVAKFDLEPSLGGSVKDSVNAALGFAALYVPLTTIALAMSVGLQARFAGSVWPVLIPAILLALVLFLYFPLALSGAHPRTTFGGALTAMIGALALIALASGGLAQLGTP